MYMYMEYYRIFVEEIMLLLEAVLNKRFSVAGED